LSSRCGGWASPGLSFRKSFRALPSPLDHTIRIALLTRWMPPSHFPPRAFRRIALRKFV
jgi:hypothetical protein